jgi:hypothetical protein
MAAAPPRPYRLGGVLRWGADEASGLQLVRRAVALVMAVLLTLLPLMQTVAAAEAQRTAAAETTRVAGAGPGPAAARSGGAGLHPGSGGGCRQPFP